VVDGRLTNHWAVTAVVAGLVLGVLAAHSSPPTMPPAPTPPPRPTCTGPTVALTFDDGPSRRNARQIADVLARHDVQATFFMTGRAVAERPGRARRFARDGHKIYNHTYDHVDLTDTPDDGIRQQVTATDDALQAAGISTEPLVRPPYGKMNRRVRGVLRDMGYRSVRWTVDPNDWDAALTADEIHHAVADELAPRANILLHDKEDSQETVQALPRIIDTARRRGYCFGVVNDRGKVVRATGH
jgi:peptidoglycan/xylan/chitin deacetylase (PgdA/CDA1 family)